MTKRKASWDDLTPEQAERLRNFKAQYAPQCRSWKQRLLDMWFLGFDTDEPNGHLLRQIRNQHGPSWLIALKDE